MDMLFTGVVENRDDPMKLGRCQVRVMGAHTYDKTILPTQDLPWAYPMQPATSAAMNGIGYAPVGPVEGTVVVVVFRDYPDNQQPIILGSLGGIPQAPGPIDQEDNGPIIKQDGYTVNPTDSSAPVTSDDGKVVDQNTALPEQDGLNPASTYQISDEGLELIKKFEGVRLKAYQDSVGVWTIGYGTTRIGGNPVQEGQTITQQQADELLRQHIAKEVQPAVYGKVKAPITQSMFDALCSFTYNLGGGTLGRSTLCSELNSTKYEECANLFPDYNKAGGKVLAGLTKRRVAEQQLFMKDGIPDSNGELAQSEPTTAPVGSEQTSTDPTGTTIRNTSSGRADPATIGFKDPKGKYPMYLNEPDTNRLARHEEIKKTVVYKKEQTRDIGVLTAQNKSWSQSPIPYNSKYPFNHVYMSESGHLLEFDDTQNSERIHMYHRKGTFYEIDANGTRVTRIVGDDYEILERNGFVHIKGTMNVTIDGDSNVRVNNALNVDVHGKTTINVFNDVDMNVSGTMDLSVKEDLNIRAQNINMEANSTINIRSTALNETAASVSVEATSIYRETVNESHYRWNGDKYTFIGADTFSRNDSGTDHGCPSDPSRSGAAACPTVIKATRANRSGLATPQPREAPELPQFATLQVVTRALEAAAVYETPDEGDPTNYINKRLSDGTLAPEEKDSGTKQDEQKTPENKLEGLPPNCAALNGNAITADLQLSKSFKLGELCQNGTRMPVDQVGLTAADITCNLKCLAENCLDKIKERYPGMMITSGFRRPGNVANSSPKSQHYNGEAADIVIKGFDRQKHYEAIQEIQKLIPYDQLILEYSGASTVWIHVSYSNKANRKQNFTMRDHRRVSEFGTFTLIT